MLLMRTSIPRETAEGQDTSCARFGIGFQRGRCGGAVGWFLGGRGKWWCSCYSFFVLFLLPLLRICFLLLLLTLHYTLLLLLLLPLLLTLLMWIILLLMLILIELLFIRSGILPFCRPPPFETNTSFLSPMLMQFANERIQSAETHQFPTYADVMGWRY